MALALEFNQYRQELERDLLNLYGPIISTKPLSQLLGFKSVGAFKQGILRDTISIPIFNIEKRHGKFALTKDVAEWLVQIRFKALEKKTGDGIIKP